MLEMTCNLYAFPRFGLRGWTLNEQRPRGQHSFSGNAHLRLKLNKTEVIASDVRVRHGWGESLSLSLSLLLCM